MSRFSFHVVIPAAGVGQRCGLETPKQFCPINGRAIIDYTVEKFLSHSSVGNIVVVAPNSKQGMDKMANALSPQTNGSSKVYIIQGCDTRHRSILEGLKCLKEILSKTGKGRNDVVVIHDGVRPFVNHEDIDRVVEAAAKYQGAGMVKPLVSTVISLDNEDRLVESLDRSKYWASEMPQAFHFDKLLQAYLKCTEFDLDNGTEVLQIFSKYGGLQAKLLQGNPNRLWKITHQHDMTAATFILSKQS